MKRRRSLGIVARFGASCVVVATGDACRHEWCLSWFGPIPFPFILFIDFDGRVILHGCSVCGLIQVLCWHISRLELHLSPGPLRLVVSGLPLVT